VNRVPDDLREERTTGEPAGEPDGAGRDGGAQDEDRVPTWAWIAAALLAAAALAVFVAGRGGTAVLLGVALTFGAVATVVLSLPDRDPAAD
jgi:hypothetical protein